MFGAPLPEMWEARGDSDGTCHGATLTLNEGAMPQLRSSAVGMVRAGRRGKGVWDAGPADRHVPAAPHWRKTGLSKTDLLCAAQFLLG